jgi:hypothetical protein
MTYLSFLLEIISKVSCLNVCKISILIFTK